MRAGAAKAPAREAEGPSRRCRAKMPPSRTSLERRTIMPNGYWIVRVSVRNAVRYPEYLAAARSAFDKYGARFLVRGGRFDAMEGSSRERNVVVEFRDYATALACYRSPEYQSAKAIRNANADADLVIVEGDGA
jgi:uncharacterized protein (DUF1330 family)